VSIESDIAILERVPSLRLLGRDALRVLAIGAETRYVDDGEVLFYAGDKADSGYLIQEGSFRLMPDEAAGKEEITAHPGTLLGELALVSPTATRPVTAVARGPAAVVRISRSLFLKTLQNYPDAALRLRDQIAMRVDQAAKEFESVRVRFDLGEATPQA